MIDRRWKSRELGLELARDLLDVQDLHYGLWDDNLELSLANLPAAQQRYTDMILTALPRPNTDARPLRMLDIGCGTGHMMAQLLDRGYEVDGVVPETRWAEQVRQRLAPHKGTWHLFECRFENFPVESCRHQYDIVLFSESFQYIPLPDLFSKLPDVTRPKGVVLICDFFKTAAHCDGGPGDRSISGGHILSEFYDAVANSNFTIERDDDITEKVSPNYALLNDLLGNRIGPAATTVNRYLMAQHAFSYRALLWLFRKKIERLHYKYFSGYRSQETFERYKSYRLVILRNEATKNT